MCSSSFERDNKPAQLPHIWINVHRQNKPIAPLLPNYRIADWSKTQSGLIDYGGQRVELTEARPEVRDIFTKRVCSFKVDRPTVDEQFLRKLGHCLPTENETLRYKPTLVALQRSSTKPSLKVRPSITDLFETKEIEDTSKRLPSIPPSKQQSTMAILHKEYVQGVGTKEMDRTERRTKESLAYRRKYELKQLNMSLRTLATTFNRLKITESIVRGELYKDTGLTLKDLNKMRSSAPGTTPEDTEAHHKLEPGSHGISLEETSAYLDQQGEKDLRLAREIRRKLKQWSANMRKDKRNKFLETELGGGLESKEQSTTEM